MIIKIVWIIFCFIIGYFIGDLIKLINPYLDKIIIKLKGFKNEKK